MNSTFILVDTLMPTDDRTEQVRGHGEDASASRGGDRLDAAAFSRLFRESFRLLWLIAMGVVANRTLAEDVVQEAAIVAYRKLDQFEPGTSFTAWMGQMVRFTALNIVRKERNQAQACDENSVLESGRSPHPASRSSANTEEPLRLTSSFELPHDQAEFDDDVASALREVSDEARACLLLRVVENLDYQEISRLLDMPEGTAMSHVHRTKQLLRDRLKDRAPATRSNEDLKR